MSKSFVPLIAFILFMSGCAGDLAQAAGVGGSTFKPMVVGGGAATAAPAAVAAPGTTPFPKLTGYPNINSGQTPLQGQTILDNVQQIPPNQMVPNKSPNPADLIKLLQGMTGSNGAPFGNGPSSTGADGTIYYPGEASDDGDISAHDRKAHGPVGTKCDPYVDKDYANEFAKIPVHADLSKVSGAHCNNHPTDRLVCMVCNLYFEVDPHDSYEGAVAVARSVMTRAVSSPYPADVCKVVYQHTARVAQYSWTFERPSWSPDHILPSGPDARVERMFRAAVEAFQKGPNGYTNYYAQNIVNPSWSHDGSCAATLCTIEHHTFCAISGRQDRSAAMYLRTEGIDASAAGVSDASYGTGAVK